MRRPQTTWASIAALAAVGCLAAACGPVAPDPTTSRPLPQAAPSTTASTTTTSTTTTTTVPAAGSTVSYAWGRSSTLPANLAGGSATEPTATLADVLAPKSGGDWVLAGTATSPAGTNSATLWTSRNAASWKATRLPGRSGSQARAAVYWGNRTVVVGSVGDGPSERAAVWISHDLTAAFKAVPDSPALDAPPGGADVSAGTALPSGDSATPAVTSGPGATMDSVAAGALGLFASGTVAGHLALWYSTNGTNWVRLSSAERTIRSAPGAVVRQIVETPTGVFAVGSVRRNGHTTGALWASGDAFHWHVASGGGDFGAGGDATLTSISTFGPNLVLGGGVRLSPSWVPASWISPNSATWGTPSESFPEPSGLRPDPTGAVVTDMSAAPDSNVMAAVGGSPTEQRLWTSTDAINWSPVALPKAAADDAGWTAGAVATTGSTTVVVDTSPSQPHLLVRGLAGAGRWREISAPFGTPRTVVTPTHLVTDGGRLVMTVDVDQPGRSLGGDRDSTEILTSADGRHWKVAGTSDTFVGQTVTDLAVTARGLVAVGGPSTTTAAVTGASTGAVTGGGSSREPATTTVWTSTDGVSWTTLRLGPSGATFPPAPDAPPGVNPGGTEATVPASTGAAESGPATTVVPATTAAPSTTVVASSTTAPVGAAPVPTTTAGGGTTGARGAARAHLPTAAAPASYGAPAGAVTSLGKTVFVAGSSAGQGVVGWKSPGRKAWNPIGALQASASTGSAEAAPAEGDTVAGGCSTSDVAVLVGSAGTGEGGSDGMAWAITGSAGTNTLVRTANSAAAPGSSAHSGSSSQSATPTTEGIAPTPPIDSAEELLGCTVTAENTFVAWGGSATGSGTPEAALWTSKQGTTWTRQAVPAWTSGSGTAALTDVASNGSTWLAVGGSAHEPWTEDTLSGLALWESGNDGKTWKELDTTTAPWDATIGVSANLVAFLGATPVVVGQTDGHLAVWTGTPTL